jgi:hypothetical protein
MAAAVADTPKQMKETPLYTTSVTTYAKRKPQGATKHSYLKGEVPNVFHIKPVDSLQRRNSNVLRTPSYFWHLDD